MAICTKINGIYGFHICFKEIEVRAIRCLTKHAVSWIMGHCTVGSGKNFGLTSGIVIENLREIGNI